MSSYLGELQIVVWALKDVKGRVRGNKICLHTDSNSVFHRLTRTPRKEISDNIRVMRMLSWLWDNFLIPSLLRMEFIPGDLNTIADTFSRWYQRKKEKETKNTKEIWDVTSVIPTQRELKRPHSEGHWGVDKLN